MADGPSRSFQELTVWRKAHSLVLAIYRTTAAFPNDERYGLTSQMRRAAVSVPANIAEGYRKLGRGDKIRYLNISQGSLEEVRYYLILTNDLGYATTDALADQLDEVARLLAAYIYSLRRPPTKPPDS